MPLPVVQRDARTASDPDVFWTGRWRWVGLLRRIRLAPVASDPEPMVLRGTVLVPRDGLLVRRIS